MNKILVEVSIGELLDKISILEIKKEKIKDSGKLKFIEDEYKCSDVPVRVGERTVHAGVDVEHKGLSCILSFAAYHCLCN